MSETRIVDDQGFAVRNLDTEPKTSKEERLEQRVASDRLGSTATTFAELQIEKSELTILDLEDALKDLQERIQYDDDINLEQANAEIENIKSRIAELQEVERQNS